MADIQNIQKQLLSELTSEPNSISNNLPYKTFRLGTETKGLLEKAGSIYYGTGANITSTVTLEDNNTVTTTIPQTAALNPPTTAGTYTLKCTVDANGKATLKWE